MTACNKTRKNSKGWEKREQNSWRHSTKAHQNSLKIPMPSLGTLFVSIKYPSKKVAGAREL